MGTEISDTNGVAVNFIDSATPFPRNFTDLSALLPARFLQCGCQCLSGTSEGIRNPALQQIKYGDWIFILVYTAVRILLSVISMLFQAVYIAVTGA